MWKSGTFDLEDINETLMDEIVFFEIDYSGMCGPIGVCGPECVTFITKSGDEYIISRSGTEWHIADMVKLFPDIYEAFRHKNNGMKNEYGLTVVGKWIIISGDECEFFVREDYFEKFYAIYQTESKSDKEFPWNAARLLFGRKGYIAPDEKMVYIKTKECWDKERQEIIARERETEKNRLQDTDVPWIKYKSNILEGYIKFWVRKNDDGTFSGFRWFIQVQKEQYEEGSYQLDAPIECYNLFLQKYENMDEKIFDEFEEFYHTYVVYHRAGKFVRSYKHLEKAKEAVSIRNEWVGWGNVNKKNVYMIDYEYLKTQIEADPQICIF
jgi:hypothetical protein